MRGVLAMAIAGGVMLTAIEQETRSAQQLFEAGQDNEALHAVAQARERSAAGPDDGYLAGQILLRMDQNDNARGEFERLAQGGDDVWKLVGESAAALVGGDTARALEVSTRSVGLDANHFHAQYQLGLVKARMEDWAGAAEAFGRAAEINPTFAYAHYYAGLSNSWIKRMDRTSEYLERFLKLAPRAPERPKVEVLMRTLRGR